MSRRSSVMCQISINRATDLICSEGYASNLYASGGSGDSSVVHARKAVDAWVNGEKEMDIWDPSMKNPNATHFTQVSRAVCNSVRSILTIAAALRWSGKELQEYISAYILCIRGVLTRKCLQIGCYTGFCDLPGFEDFWPATVGSLSSRGNGFVARR